MAKAENLFQPSESPELRALNNSKGILAREVELLERELDEKARLLEDKRVELEKINSAVNEARQRRVDEIGREIAQLTSQARELLPLSEQTANTPLDLVHPTMDIPDLTDTADLASAEVA